MIAAAPRLRPGRRSPRSATGTAAVLVFLALGLGLGACSRLHMTPSHGRAYHAAFAIQDANPNRKAPKSLNGLDSQEAAIIAGSYRKGLAPKTDTPQGANQLLMVAPNRGGGDNNVQMAPSVPSGN
jgi:hypothetical protein